MKVKGFNNHELNEAFRVSPEIVCNYISALKRAHDMSEETNRKAIEKIRKLTKAIDDISNSERKTILDLNEENIMNKEINKIKAMFDKDKHLPNCKCIRCLPKSPKSPKKPKKPEKLEEITSHNFGTYYKAGFNDAAKKHKVVMKEVLEELKSQAINKNCFEEELNQRIDNKLNQIERG